jgi:hypothetical protein
MFDLFKNVRSIVPDGINMILRPRFFVRDWKSSRTPGTHPLFVLVCAVGLFTAVAGISSAIGLDKGLNRWVSATNPEVVPPSGGFPSLLKIGKIRRELSRLMLK